MSYRWFMASILCIVQLLVYYQRTAMSIAIVDIVHEDEKVQQPQGEDETTSKLTRSDVGPILAAGWVGNVIGPIPISYLVARYGPRNFMLLTLPLASILTTMTPLFVGWGFYWTLASKLILGFLPVGQPGIVAQMGARWMPSNERGKYFSLIGIGDTLGDMLSLVVGGLIYHYVNWEASFYILGGISLATSILIFFFIFDCPTHCPKIGRNELEMLATHLDPNGEKQNLNELPPFMKMFKCPAVWACGLGNLSDSLNYCLLSIVGPLFLDQIFDVQIRENGLILGFMYSTSMMAGAAIGPLSDFMIQRGISVLLVRKIFTGLHAIPTAVCTIGLAYSEDNFNASIAIMFLLASCYGGVFAGYRPNATEVSKNHSSAISSLALIPGNIPTIGIPCMMAMLESSYDEKMSWKIVFITMAVMNILVFSIYLATVRVGIQSWDQDGVTNASSTNVNDSDDGPADFEKDLDRNKNSNQSLECAAVAT